MTLAICTLWRY